MAVAERVAERRVVLHGVSWKTYEALMADHADQSTPRFTYDRGNLEIEMPRGKHENLKRTLELVVHGLATELDVPIYSLGSTTFRRPELERGAEPDSCFYTANMDRVIGKDEIELPADPPPDLVIEVDITNPSIPRQPIYAAFGVPELWRHDGERLEILFLEGDRYIAASRSQVFPGVRSHDLTRLIATRGHRDDVVWLDTVRTWGRGFRGDGAG